MSSFTYETKDTKTPLERLEWDNVWWECTDEQNKPRVLYIGDSISCASRRVATATSENSILFDGFGTSKGIDNPYFADSVRIFAAQQGHREAIIFNNGLHGWHLDDETEYRKHYEDFVKFLKKEFEGTPLFIVLTTTTANEERNKRVCVRNKVASEIAEKYGCGVIDLHTVSVESVSLLSPDGVHFTQDGYKVLAAKIVSELKAAVPALNK